MMNVFKTISDLQTWRTQTAAAHPDAPVHFVPTMGALHEGHAELLHRARQPGAIVVLSIFVNPTQFNSPADLDKYPRTLEADLEIARQCGVDAVFLPTFDDIYPKGYLHKIVENDFSRELCGLNRPGHFDGVLTVVMKLFQLIKPTRAFFGEKDFQQLTLIQQMVADFFLPIEIVGVPTVRGSEGLALSSRNTRLSAEGLKLANEIYYALTKIDNLAKAREFLTSRGFVVEYLVEQKDRRFVAAWLEEVRLIDNVPVVKKAAGMVQPLKILLTVGGTQEAIDSVRSITNVSSGKTGFVLAEEFLKAGHEVFVLRAARANWNWSLTAQKKKMDGGLNEISFTDFFSLQRELKTALESRPFDAIVHLAAVSDYHVGEVLVNGVAQSGVEKIDSASERIELHLVKNSKLLQSLKTWSKNHSVLVVAFKFMDHRDSKLLTDALKKMADQKQVDWIVQNDVAAYQDGLLRDFRFFDGHDLQQAPTLLKGVLALGAEIQRRLS